MPGWRSSGGRPGCDEHGAVGRAQVGDHGRAVVGAGARADLQVGRGDLLVRAGHGDQPRLLGRGEPARLAAPGRPRPPGRRRRPRRWRRQPGDRRASTSGAGGWPGMPGGCGRRVGSQVPACGQTVVVGPPRRPAPAGSVGDRVAAPARGSGAGERLGSGSAVGLRLGGSGSGRDAGRLGRSRLGVGRRVGRDGDLEAVGRLRRRRRRGLVARPAGRRGRSGPGRRRRCTPASASAPSATSMPHPVTPVQRPLDPGGGRRALDRDGLVGGGELGRGRRRGCTTLVSPVGLADQHEAGQLAQPAGDQRVEHLVEAGAVVDQLPQRRRPGPSRSAAGARWRASPRMPNQSPGR